MHVATNCWLTLVKRGLLNIHELDPVVLLKWVVWGKLHLKVWIARWYVASNTSLLLFFLALIHWLTVRLTWVVWQDCCLIRVTAGNVKSVRIYLWNLMLIHLSLLDLKSKILLWFICWMCKYYVKSVDNMYVSCYCPVYPNILPWSFMIIVQKMSYMLYFLWLDYARVVKAQYMLSSRRTMVTSDPLVIHPHACDVVHM